MHYCFCLLAEIEGEVVHDVSVMENETKRDLERTTLQSVVENLGAHEYTKYVDEFVVGVVIDAPDDI